MNISGKDATMRTLTTYIHQEHGSMTVIMGLSLAVVMGFAAFAVDLGYLYVKKSQLQQAADNAAMAGASALVSQRGDLAAVRAVVLDYARSNLDDMDVPTSAVTDGDISFHTQGALGAAPDQVEVTVRRTLERTNPVSLFFARVLGADNADLMATARAGVVPVCSSRCVKPFIIPAKFDWDDEATGSGSKYSNNGKLDVDSPEEMASVNVTGYGEEDVGTPVILKYGDPGDTMVPSQYSPVDFPPVNKGVPVTGASEYRANIGGCDGSNFTLVELGDELYLEPGNMTGPTNQGLKDLLDEDPFAYWDDSTKSVQDSSFEDPLASPRVAVVAFFDPRTPPTSGRNSLVVYQLGAVFIENQSKPGEIRARFMNAVARSPEPGEGDCLLFIPRLALDSSRGA